MIKKNKNILIFLGVGMVLIISMFFVLNKSHEYKELPKVKVKEQNNLKQFALMLEQENGEYKESEGEFPTEGYAFNESKSGCTDINGKIIDGALNYDYETYTVLVDTSKTSYCYLYYDKEPNISYLRSKDSNGQITEKLTGGMYRYQGTDNVANWILFGTKEECNKDEENKCTNAKLNNMTYADYVDKYMYRIIGINAKGELYLLKETFLKEESVGAGLATGFVWNDEYYASDSYSYSCPNGICPEWNNADLFQRINGTANGTNAGKGGYTSKADTDIFVDSTYYDYLKSGDKINSEEASDWYNLINTHEWYYGDTIEISDAKLYNGDEMYNIETGRVETNHYVKKEDGVVTSQTYKWTNKVNAKISLMYLHDMIYTYPGGIPESPSIVKRCWIHFKKDGYNNDNGYEWLSTRWGFLDTSSVNAYARRVNTEGNLSYVNGLNYVNGVRPVFYVSNKVTIANGIGTKDSPFILSWN